MIVPDHWAEARRQHRAATGQITVRRFGWSADSAEAARAMAERRAEEALARLIAGENLPRREPKVPYNGAEGVPIREEVLARHGEEVITRNAYGARCLNSPCALFADVDFESRPGMKPVLAAFGVLALAAALIGLYQGSVLLGLLLLVVSVVLSAPMATLLRRVGARAQGDADTRARRRLATFLASRPEWNVRIYRTPAGLRLLATHRPFNPGETDVAEFFRAVETDPVYVRMCLNQHCFRARLSAKPWRIGLPSHLRPRPGVWPVAPEHMTRRNAWIAEYEARAAKFAACRYVESLGSGTVDRRLKAVIDLHDRESRANDAGSPVA